MYVGLPSAPPNLSSLKSNATVPVPPLITLTHREFLEIQTAAFCTYIMPTCGSVQVRKVSAEWKHNYTGEAGSAGCLHYSGDVIGLQNLHYSDHD
jgi:hypothetical protein